MSSLKRVFVIVGAGGYPFKISAAGNKFFLMAKALYENGFDVNLVNKSRTVGYNEVVYEDNIKCFFLLGNREKCKFLSRFLDIVFSEIRVMILLKNLAGAKKYLMISYCPMYLLVYYWTLSRLFNYRLVFSLMEDHYNNANKLHSKINAYLFWHVGLLMADGAIPISEYLKSKVIKINGRIPVLKVPVLADFNSIINIVPNKSKNYFLYCGSIGYAEVIEFILKAFEKIEDKSISLFLVLHGKEELIKEYDIITRYDPRIVIYRDLKLTGLLKLYAESKGLLIPLRPNKQDIARFPQKIAEYLSSGRPVITNNVGEIKEYFNKNNAIIASDYSVSAYYEAMQFVLNNPELSDSIGLNGRKLGYKNFHYQSISKEFTNFLLSIR